MRNVAFAVFILCLSALLIILALQQPKAISSQSEIQNLQDNQKVLVTGAVVQQNSYYITLDSNLSLYCYKCPSFKNQSISVLGIIDSYDNKKEIKVLRIKTSN